MKIEEGLDYYYNDHGMMVLTAHYLLKRGYCCGNPVPMEAGVRLAVIIVRELLIVRQTLVAAAFLDDGNLLQKGFGMKPRPVIKNRD